MFPNLLMFPDSSKFKFWCLKMFTLKHDSWDLTVHTKWYAVSVISGYQVTERYVSLLKMAPKSKKARRKFENSDIFKLNSRQGGTVTWSRLFLEEMPEVVAEF